MGGTANPIEQIGGLTNTSNVPKADVVSWGKARVAQVMADAAEINASDLSGQLVILLKSNGRSYDLDTSDSVTVDDGVNCIRDFNGLAFKLNAITGVDGTNGTDAGMRWLFASSTSMADPSAGNIRFNNASFASITALAISYDSGESGNPDASAFVKTWDDSSTTAHRGLLVIKKVSAPQNFVILDVTAGLTDNTTWLQATVAYVAGAGSFSAADVLSIQFYRTGDIGVAGANGTGNSGFINKIRNGTFDIWLRGTSALASKATTVWGYQCDGWATKNTFGSGAGPVMSRATNNRTGARRPYGLKILGATGVTDVLVGQPIESIEAYELAGQSVTFQAWIYNNTGGSITPQLTVKNPTVADTYSSTTTDVSAQNLQACPNAAWTQVSYTWTASANSTLGVEFYLDLGNNFSSNSKYVILAEADLRVAAAVETAELRPAASEAIICARYLFGFGAGVGIADSITEASFAVSHPMIRATPTSVESTGVLTVTNEVSANYTQSSPSVSINNNAQYGGRYRAQNFTGMTAGALADLAAFSSAIFLISAEIAP